MPVPAAALGAAVLSAPRTSLSVPVWNMNALPLVGKTGVDVRGVPPAVEAAAPVAASLPAVPAEGKPAVRTLESAGKDIAEARKAKNHSAFGDRLKGLFDGTSRRAAAPVSIEDFRMPDWSEDRRINRALRRLADSSIGVDLYKYVDANHSLEILVDDDHSADYDARLEKRDGRTILYLTENLVDRESPEAVAAYIAREMSELYFESFPASAERTYMGYSNMVRVFAELTNSGRAANYYWWDTDLDQWKEGAYAMRRYYGSWKEAVTDYGRDAARSPFFRWLESGDGVKTDPAARRSLYARYRAGEISSETYREMGRYFDSIRESESRWLTGTGRR